MLLVDTSAWIEWLIASPTGKIIEGMVPPRENWLVPTIVQLELAKWLTREVGADKADQVIAFTQTCVVASLETPIALAAAEISVNHRLATADAIVYATAMEYQAEVLTCDAHFKDLPNVKFVAKIKA
ncbi:VapC toxin family PIN domain ribonuclease [Phyllobacterium brassicacearum]|uniref:VapC toxin family PIN domain ribonuclease n=1 Tax=Phyllobacterium brassicacearum TaxID=314235 RepID=A0A2P7AJX6_9HYPH|nr:type II toxin-antitoxin system VapC family toxin [Phyllobacterium brassicacearum]PSH54508.1 VapC toxin family PIN domain ribonuclease [Phyllobacterium brassicacearum]TDQ20413.1 putative nucleic acid-binding protein [Phyllobacterium brassicacearum]